MKKKILFLIDSLGGGGAEKVLLTLLTHIDRTKFDITLTTIVDTRAHIENIPNNILYKPILKTPKNIIERIWYSVKYKLVHTILPLKLVYKIFIPKGNDVEVAFVEGFSTKLLSTSSNQHAKRVAWVHTDLKNNHWTKNIYKDIDEERQAYSKFDVVVGVADQVTEVLKKHYGLNNTITLHNLIDKKDIISKSKGIIPGLKKRKSLRLVTVGRLEHQKGYDRLLRIINRLIYEDKIDLELWIIGDGSLCSQLINEATELGILNNVRFYGFQKNPYIYMAGADLFVCSSRSEGFSTVVTEAVILDIPVVTTDCSGMKELLGDNNEYGLVTENSEDALYKGMKELLLNKSILKTYKDAASKLSKEFCLEKLIEPIETILYDEKENSYCC